MTTTPLTSLSIRVERSAPTRQTCPKAIQTPTQKKEQKTTPGQTKVTDWLKSVTAGSETPQDRPADPYSGDHETDTYGVSDEELERQKKLKITSAHLNQVNRNNTTNTTPTSLSNPDSCSTPFPFAQTHTRHDLVYPQTSSSSIKSRLRRRPATFNDNDLQEPSGSGPDLGLSSSGSLRASSLVPDLGFEEDPEYIDHDAHDSDSDFEDDETPDDASEHIGHESVTDGLGPTHVYGSEGEAKSRRRTVRGSGGSSKE
ncbi:hypothetical protein V8F33_012108 [Rhypophila sp. PSN 637]